MHVRRQNHHRRHHGLRVGTYTASGILSAKLKPRTNFARTRHRRRHCHSHIRTRCGLIRICSSQHLVHCQFRYHQTKRMCLVLAAYRVLVLTRTPYDGRDKLCRNRTWIVASKRQKRTERRRRLNSVIQRSRSATENFHIAIRMCGARKRLLCVRLLLLLLLPKH